MSKIALIVTIVFFFVACSCISSTSQIGEKTSVFSDDKYSGLYKGVYFFEDFGSTEKIEIDPIILINDTCSYILFCGVLEKIITINDNLITFGNINAPCEICIGEGQIVDNDDYGEVITKTGKVVEGLMKKTSDITDNEIARVYEALREKQQFMAFWDKFIEALNTNNAELLAEYVHFPFEDVYGKFYPKIVNRGIYDSDNRNEFIKKYRFMFTDNVKANLNNNTPVKLYYLEIYYINASGFRPFNFEKINGVWKLSKFPYEV